jgi:hypothetical protein
MAMVRQKHRHEEGRVTLDMVIGAVVFGIVGAAIGYYLDTTGSIAVAAAIGTVFGLLIGLLGGRRFFVSIVSGSVLGGTLFGLVAGRDSIALGAGVGGAIGGFLGVQMGMLLDLWKQHKESVPTQPPTSNDPKAP